MEEQLRPDVHAVLTTDGGGPLELTTLGVIAGAVTEPGTYLHNSDLARLGAHQAHPAMRRYNRLIDTGRKAFSRQGLVYLVTLWVGLVAAAAGVALAIGGKSGPTVTNVADTAQAVIRWTDRPADQLDPPLRGARVVAIRRDLDGRATVAADCLTLLRGGLGPKATVPGVQCSPDTPPWYEAASTGPIVAAVAGLVTIAFSVFNIGDKFGFGKSPAGP